MRCPLLYNNTLSEGDDGDDDDDDDDEVDDIDAVVAKEEATEGTMAYAAGMDEVVDDFAAAVVVVDGVDVVAVAGSGAVVVLTVVVLGAAARTGARCFDSCSRRNSFKTDLAEVGGVFLANARAPTRTVELTIANIPK